MYPSTFSVVAVDRASGEVVRELRRVGAFVDVNGELPDVFDERAGAALVAFMHVENLENRVRDDGRIELDPEYRQRRNAA